MRNTIFSKIIKLIKNPKKEYLHIIPYIKSKIFYYKKIVYEFFSIDILSKPYSGHDKLFKYLNRKNGFFIAAGGNDGYNVDPTYYLEKFLGWRGIIIEPLPIFSTCQKNRKKSSVFNFALVSSDYSNKTISMIDCNAMSVIKDSFDGYKEFVKEGEKAQNMKSKEIKVNTSTLNNVIELYSKNKKMPEIDLLVLDIEGYELNALKGLDFLKYSPKFILLEIHSKKEKELLDIYLFTKNYKYVDSISFADYLYMKN